MYFIVIKCVTRNFVVFNYVTRSLIQCLLIVSLDDICFKEITCSKASFVKLRLDIYVNKKKT